MSKPEFEAHRVDGRITQISTITPSGLESVWEGSIEFKPGDLLTVARATGSTAYPIINGKPRELAAGQVWERRRLGRNGIEVKERRTITGPDSRLAGRWWCGELPEDWVDAWPMLNLPEWRYLGTREEVAAREAKARPEARSLSDALLRPSSPSLFLDGIEIGWASARQKTAEIIEIRGRMEAMSLRELTSAPAAEMWGTKELRIGSDAFTVHMTAINSELSDPLRSIYKVIVEVTEYDLRVDPATGQPVLIDGKGVIRDAVLARMKERESDADLRQRCASMGPVVGTRAWLEKSIGAELGVDPYRVHIDESTPGTVAVWVDDYRGTQLAHTLTALNEMLPLGVLLVERGPLLAAPTPAPTPPPWTMADCRREIDRLVAADYGPFARARAAALRAWAEHDLRSAVPQNPAGRVGDLREYERVRGGARTPSAKARWWAEEFIGTGTIAVYERERGR